MSGNKVHSTVSRRANRFTVAPSPLNAVKFELGVVFVIGILLLLIHKQLFSDSGLQILALLGYGVLCAVWIIFRARRVMLRVILTDREQVRGGEK